MKKSFRNKASILIESNNKAKILTILLQNNLSYYELEIKERTIILVVPLRDALKTVQCLNDEGFYAKIAEKKGFLVKLTGIKKRPGIILGIFIMLTVAFLSSKTLWSIDIEGNSKISDQEIIDALSESGFGLGVFVPSVDYDKLHNNVLMKLDELSWISVNIDGNRANVKVMETKKEEIGGKISYSNIVASDDAQISSIIVLNGEKITEIGKIVKKGELLVSGVIESQSMGVRYVDADAKIKGYVNKKIDIKIPFKNVKKVYTGNECSHIEYKIFNNITFFSINYGNLPLNYDTIIKKECVDFFGITDIPYEIHTTRYLEYYEQEYVYSLQEAIDIAFMQLREQMDIELKDAELISKSIKTSYDDDNFYISCDIYCLEDICEKNTIYVN